MLIDFEHLVTVEIINPPRSHRQFLEEEFHFIRPGSAIEQEKDVRITFSEGVNMDPNRWVSVGAPVGYDAGGVFWHDPNYKIARIDLEHFDTRTTALAVSPDFNCHFLYKLVEYLISFKALKHGAAYCHASAVRYCGKTLVCPAWRHVGKTNLMLSLVEDGGELISDDGVLLLQNGEILPYSKRLHLLYFNFLAFPQLRRKTDAKMEALMKFVENARAGSYGISETRTEALQKMIRVRLPNSDVTGREHSPERYRCDFVVHLNKTLGRGEESVSLRPMGLEALVTKNTETTMFEQSHFLSAYHAYALKQSKTIPFLDSVSKRIAEVFRHGFSHAQGRYELTFNRQLDLAEAKRAINEMIYGA